MVGGARFGAAALAVFGSFALCPSARAGCDDARKDAAGSALSMRDLIEITEIAFPDGSVNGASPPVAVDPGGTRIAFIETRADLASNRYCYTLKVLDLNSGSSRTIAVGGDYSPAAAAMRGNLAIWGSPIVAEPVWSPDGRWIAWLRRDAGSTQAWIAAADGGGARQVTRADSDVTAVRWRGVDELAFATRPAMASMIDSIAREGRSGWLYDDRVTPNAGAQPRIPVASVPVSWFSIEIDGAVPRVLSEPPAKDELSPSGDQLSISHPDDVALGQSQLTWRTRAGVERTCPESCRGWIVGAWWQPSRDIAWFLRREGWKRETSAIYRWRAGGAPERVVATTDPINYCKPAALGLVCVRESSTYPQRIVRIDWKTAQPRVVYDPNPGFARFKLGTVTRLRWRNDRGLEAWGDLVLPPGYRRGEKLPLIVTQYYSRGFLRGGIGNEYPIYLFAQRGFAVLSLERPDDVAILDPKARTPDDVNRLDTAGWADRRSVQSSIETGVRMAVATGAIDPARIGIAGLSDGGTSVRFALINSVLFAAAATSSCCVEPDTLGIAGPAFAKTYLGWGAPKYGSPGDEFWKPVALSLNADKIDTPLLMQLSDDEYLLALGAFEALRARGKPVELYVFPEEHHNKSQPVHRQAIYDRNLDWFDFWLRGKEDPNPAKREQYRRWEKMRAAR